jgi:hypothetical protein
VTADLLIIVPTRRRRARLEQFLDAFDATRDGATDLLIVTDDDDDSYAGLTLPRRAGTVSRPRTWLGPKVNPVATLAARTYPAVGFLGDDAEPVTPGWDRILMSYLDTPGIAYPENGRRRDVCEHQIVSSCIIRALGWYFEPTLMHYWTDTVLTELGARAGCLRYVAEAIVLHRHYDSGGTYDPVYAESVDANGGRDQVAYNTWRESRMEADVQVVRAAIAGTQ